jgi:hypothetical protein
VLLTRTATTSGLVGALSAALTPWRKSLARHDPAKVLLDLAISLVLGGDACRDVALIRSEPGLYGLVASDATISRTIAALAGDVAAVEKAVATARTAARAHVWTLAGRHAPNQQMSASHALVIDLDATLITAHSDKEAAAATFKKTFGFHPLCAFADHGPHGTGESLAMLLRPGNAGSNTATDHVTLTKQALTAVPGINPTRPGKKVLIRTDGAGGSREFLGFLHRRGLSYSIGYTLPASTPELYALLPATAWQDALDADGALRDGAAVVEFTDLLTSTNLLKGYPPGMRVIVRRERPHPGAQLRFSDVEGYRLTAFVTNTTRGQLADLELRHRRRARCEDRIRIAKDTRSDEPALAGLRPEPDLAPDRPDRRRPAHLDRSAGLPRAPGPPVGTQDAAAAALHDRRDPGPHGPTATPAHQDHRALGGTLHHRLGPPHRPRTPLTSAYPHPNDPQPVIVRGRRRPPETTSRPVVTPTRHNQTHPGVTDGPTPTSDPLCNIRASPEISWLVWPVNAERCS